MNTLLIDFANIGIDPINWLRILNAELSGWLGAGILLMLFVIIFSVTKAFGFAESMAISIYVTFIGGALFFALGLINEAILTLLVIVLGAAIVNQYLSRN